MEAFENNFVLEEAIYSPHNSTQQNEVWDGIQFNLDKYFFNQPSPSTSK